MKKFGVFSGFLGSGKTSTMIALTKYLNSRGLPAAMISNDLGGPGLADNRLASLSGCQASELTGTCICYQTENLVARLRQLFDREGVSLVLSDIPGFGVGALEHVYHTLSRDYPDEFPLCPFTAVCEPAVLKKLQSGGGELAYIFKSQLREADLIVLNKCDLLSPAQRQDCLAWLQREFPQAQAIGISARSGEGLEELSQKLLKGSASLQSPDLGYGGSEFTAAMGKFSEFNIQYFARVCCDSFDGSQYLRSLAEEIQKDISAVPGGDIPHLKLLAWEPEGDYSKLDALGAGREIQCIRAFSRPCTELAVIINTSAVFESRALDELICSCIDRVSEEYNLSLVIYKKECFGAMGDGK